MTETLSSCSQGVPSTHFRAPRRGRWCSHLEEGVELLLFLPVHITFLKELEVRHEAPAWPDVSAWNKNICRWVLGAGTEPGRGCDTPMLGWAAEWAFSGPSPLRCPATQPWHLTPGAGWGLLTEGVMVQVVSTMGTCIREGDRTPSTHLRLGRISEFSPGSCFPNWLQGKPRMTRPKGASSSCSAFSSGPGRAEGWPGKVPTIHPAQGGHGAWEGPGSPIQYIPQSWGSDPAL